MKYLPIPIAMLQIGQPLPVTIWSAQGKLLLKKGNPILSEQHRDRLAEHRASTTYEDGMAWQRAYERMVYALLRDGVSVEEIARMGMPTEIKEADFVVAKQISGGWSDLQEVLRGILYQGGLAINPLARLGGIEKKALSLLQDDVDDSLFCLFQMLADSQIGYSATHALLCGAICHLTAKKLGMSDAHAQLLMAAAMTMNIGMARDQDSMALQNNAPTEWQRELIRNHPRISVEILQSFGVDDETHLDIVRWHHGDPDGQALDRTAASRRVLSMADVFVAKMASRKTRAAVSPVGAVKDMVLGAEGDALGVGSAMAQAVGFYPPGTYLRLENGSTAVSIRRGPRANMPWVVPIVDKDGMPLARYTPLDTSKPENLIAAPLNCESVRVAVNLDKVRRVRARLPKMEAK